VRKIKNPHAAALRGKLYQPKRVPPKKGKGSFRAMEAAARRYRQREGNLYQQWLENQSEWDE
jgi:hypothetical protein